MEFVYQAITYKSFMKALLAHGSMWSLRICPDSKLHGANMGPPGACRPQVGPMLAPWALLSGWMLRCPFIITSRMTKLLLPPWSIAPKTMTDGPRFHKHPMFYFAPTSLLQTELQEAIQAFRDARANLDWSTQAIALNHVWSSCGIIICTILPIKTFWSPFRPFFFKICESKIVFHLHIRFSCTSCYQPTIKGNSYFTRNLVHINTIQWQW